MILFIIYIEPLLLHLERTLQGLNVAGIPQILEAFCDDVNIVTENLEDLPKIEDSVSKFGVILWAIFFRDYKCKITGIGG